MPDALRPHVLQASLSTTNSWSLIKFMSIELVMPSTSVAPSPPAFSLYQHQGLLQLFASGGQNIGASASASVLPMNIQNWFPLGLTGWISSWTLAESPPRDSQESHSSKASILRHSSFFIVQLSHPYVTTGKTIALTRRTFVGKVMSLLFNMLSRLVITFLPRSNCLLISWLQSPSAVIWELKNKVCHCFHCFPNYSPWSDGTRFHVLRFLNVEF